MAIQVAFVNSHGEIEWFTSPGSDDQYTEGQVYNGLIAFFFRSCKMIQEGIGPKLMLEWR